MRLIELKLLYQNTQNIQETNNNQSQLEQLKKIHILKMRLQMLKIFDIFYNNYKNVSIRNCKLLKIRKDYRISDNICKSRKMTKESFFY